MRFNLLDHPIAAMASEYTSPVLAWTGHAPFAFFIVDLLKPRTLVELGTHCGGSYCAFCQAVAHLKLPTRCFAVDTWKGDQHTGHYSEDVLTRLRAHHDPRYASFSRLLQSTFDEAVGQFDDASIDLLHIDGSHRYADVAHDFQTWIGKLSDRGVILFHDTAEKSADFGVYRLWAELAPKYPSFEFQHSHGLGVLGVGSNLSGKFLEFMEETRANPDAMRQIFAALGRANEAHCELRRVAGRAFRVQEEINRYKREIGESVDPSTENIQLAMEHPMAYVLKSLNEVGAMVRHTADMRKALRAEKR
jgi:hypothetical protein